jgi:hypothetical protein
MNKMKGYTTEKTLLILLISLCMVGHGQDWDLINNPHPYNSLDSKILPVSMNYPIMLDSMKLEGDSEISLGVYLKYDNQGRIICSIDEKPSSVTKKLYKYNSEGDVISLKRYRKDEAEEEKIKAEYEVSYDAKNRIRNFIGYDFDDSLKRTPRDKRVYAYNDKGQCVTAVSYEWDELLESFSTNRDTRKIKLFYNTSNLLDEEREYSIEGGEEFLWRSRKYLYKNEKVISKTVKYGTRKYGTEERFEYDNNGREILWERASSEGRYYVREVYERSETNYLDKWGSYLGEYTNFETSGSEAHSKVEFRFDEHGIPILKEYWKYDDIQEDWTPIHRYERLLLKKSDDRVIYRENRHKYDLDFEVWKKTKSILIYGTLR